MKKSFLAITLLLSILTITTLSCNKEDVPCGFHNGEQLFEGPKGGCYYKNSSGNKEYVDRSECNC